MARAFLPACLLISAAFGLVGCGGSAGGSAVPRIKELQINTLTEGSGPELKEGDKAWVEYTGTLMTGEEFDSNADGKGIGTPFALVIGAGSVIRGWDEGLVGMKVGEVRELLIPAAKGYGPAGSPPKIPGDSDLKFTIKLLGMIPEGSQGEYDYEEVKVGTGPEVKEGDTVVIHYKGSYLNGEEFDNSRKRGKTLQFRVGAVEPPRVVSGIDDGVRGMRLGGVRRLTLPPDLLFGPSGAAGLSGDQITIFEVEVLEINGQKA
ncbi:MAG: FKBP-type peptidyl-prolyl cis-trans isomerase [Fimbriimonadaceae bacterium]|nr:FKBP-type peptidyl-prolyl cis-trans isomerase [Fimbriimonadaceae bacterium]